MKLSYRLTMMFVSLAIILAVGWFSMKNFQFATGQFWFVSGALLLIMLSLVDQPHFSKDANVFVNGATALVSLFIIPESQRTDIWWLFCSWAIYLIVASFALMALRSRELFLETKTVQFFSRVNRAIGRPESIFSAFFLWGVFLQFSYPKDGIAINALLLFWAAFMILNVPAIAQTVSGLFTAEDKAALLAGVITGIHSPRLAVVKLALGYRDAPGMSWLPHMQSCLAIAGKSHGESADHRHRCCPNAKRCARLQKPTLTAGIRALPGAWIKRSGWWLICGRFRASPPRRESLNRPCPQCVRH